MGAECCDDRICLSVCLRVCLSVHKHISETTNPIYTSFCAYYMWLRSDTLCASGFMDDVMFVHNVAAYIATRNGRALKVTAQLVAPGAESAVYDCPAGHANSPSHRPNSY